MIALIKRLAILLPLLGTSVNFVFADGTQDLKEIYNKLLPDFQKLTPEASALGQYGKYNVSGYTGVPNISIPLFSIGSGNFSMPIELGYDASGIKVEQQATYVGLGWNLIMGGSINQIVCGQNDFFEKLSGTSQIISNLDLQQEVLPSYVTSQYLTSGMPSVTFPAIHIYGTCLPIEKDRKKFEILQDVSNGARNPDIFQASFCGHSVSFVINTFDKKAIIIGNDATNYNISLMEYSGSYPRSIEIKDDHGIKYIFTEAPKKSMEDNASYNLSKIKNPADHVLVEFKYSEAGYNLLHPYYETIGKRNEDTPFPIASDLIHKQFIDRNCPNTLQYSIKEYYPETIITDREIITITYGGREDIKKAKRIDTIIVKSNCYKDSVIHKVLFRYGYFTESGFESSLCSRYGYTDVYSYKRLKLTDIIIDGRKYSFGYNENQDLPSRLSTQQDFWGYYNGQNNAKGFCASPEFKYNYNNDKLTGLDAIGPANRYASEYHCKIGTLNKITYPTGGYTKYDYEINHFDDAGKYYYPTASSMSKVEYIRTESCGSGYNNNIKGYDSTPDTKEFDVEQPTKVEIATNTPNSQQYYKIYFTIIGKDSNGKTIFSKPYTKYNDNQDFKEILELPKGHYVLSSQFLNVPNEQIIGGNIQVTFPTEYKEDLSIADASGKSIGGGLRIKTIENYDSDNTLLGYTSYRYEDGRLLIPTVEKESITTEYLYSSTNVYDRPSTKISSFFFVTSTPTSPAICSLGCPNIGYSKVIKYNYDKNRHLISFDIEKYHNKGYNCCYNMFSVNADGLNGKLTESTTYSKDSVLMRKLSYSYMTIGNNPALSDIIFFPWTRCLNMNPGRSSFEVYYKYSLYPKYPINVLPYTTTETLYDSKGNKTTSNTTSFQYNPTNYQLSDLSVTDGTNTSRTLYSYPASNTLRFMKHNLSEVDGVKTYRNGTFTGGSKYTFKVHKNPQTGASFSVVETCRSLLPNGGSVTEMTVTSYDDYGNIREYKKKDETPVTIIWSYNHQFPVLEIVGKTYNDVTKTFTFIHDLEEAKTIDNTCPLGSMEAIHTSINMAYKGGFNKGAAEAYVTAYEYSPWGTVSRIIKPNGLRVEYVYDTYGRLKETKENGDIIQKYSYNYKNK